MTRSHVTSFFFAFSRHAHSRTSSQTQRCICIQARSPQTQAQLLAHHTQGNAHILLAGRNADAAIDSFPKVANHHHEFLPCDVSLMGNVHDACATLLVRQHTDLPRLNFLVLSPGFFPVFGSREPTAEGIDNNAAAGRRAGACLLGAWCGDGQQH
ncbi:NAD(P)-binding protein [Mycena indigotica]|uniref:NAD(P)-binding protein n=1 Tax=Mycena indigotica TaxID=2126181 RepID=A0A8H6SNZ8_9AGAR|nr:NAD(P)-binding protein [Mycena indigotica]KAF7303350.1 NAD(P)-binding protein [Mycena indigotica]